MSGALEDVRAEPPAHAVVELDDRPVPQHRFVRRAAEHEPRLACAEVAAARVNPPAALHLQMAAQDDAALEAEEDVLAHRLDLLEHAAVQPFGDALHRRRGMRCFDFDAFADEDLQSLRDAVESISLGHAPIVVMLQRMDDRQRSAAAGAAAAMVWAALEPLDQLVFRYDYSDVALLGKAVTRSRAWPVVGLALHAANGAVFGLVFAEVRRATRLPKRPLAFGMAIVEHMTLYPVGVLVDRHHPAQGERGVPQLIGSRRAYAQATLRHAVFGLVLGRLA